MPARTTDRIGFAIRDARGRSAAFHVEPGDRQALVFGAKSAVRLEGKGILPAHFVVLPTDFGLVVATADERSPAVLNGQPMPVSWTNLEIPSRIRVGTAVVDFFYARESGIVLVDQDVEATVCESRATRAAPLPSVDIPVTLGTTQLLPRRPPAALAGPSAPPARGSTALAVRAREMWTRTPASSRILLALVAVLLVIVFVR
jgi:hypothetical protein